MKKKTVILTGAGISAESGVPTFRGSDGLWEGHRVEEVATPEAFERDRALVQKFYNMRRRFLRSGIEPNEGHRALARLQRESDGEVVLVTQNIDDLHERGGSPEVWHMHGELLKARCLSCGARVKIDGDLDDESPCESCGDRGRLRPDVVWFGEMPYLMPEIETALAGCDLFLSIGTSGHVYPAAGFVELAHLAGAETIEVNLDETATSSRFHRQILGKAGEVLPDLVDELLR
ncbi:MAG: NAD-dependent deacylase [Akkermansiaceae bacterium]|jgi:NAD-dependent deacetylase